MDDKIPHIRPFQAFVYNSIPTLFDNSLSYYELLSKFLGYLNILIDSANSQGQQIEELTRLYNELSDFLNDYLNSPEFRENLSVKLDEMASDGTLARIINEDIFNLINNNIVTVSILNYGGKANDIDFDNSVAIQNAINEIYSKGGGTVLIPQGKWYVKNTIDLKGGVVLQGASTGQPDNPDNGTSLIFKNTALGITAYKTIDEQYYRWSPGIKDIGLYFEGTLLTSIGIDLDSCSHFKMNNVHIAYFGVGLRIKGGMLDRYSNVSIYACSQYGVLFANGSMISTTQLFDNIYIGQMVSGICMYVERESLINLTLNNPTFESSPAAFHSVDTNTDIAINNIYVENIPRTPLQDGLPIIRVGASDSWKGCFTIRGGTIMGHPGTTWGLTTLFDFKTLNTILIDGVQWRYFGKLLTSDSLTLPRVKPTFRNCNSEHGLVTEDLDSKVYINKIIVDNCCVKSESYGVIKEMPIQLNQAWSDFGEGYQGIKLTVNERDRIAYFSGLIKRVSSGSLITTIPEGYRPLKPMFVPVAYSETSDYKGSIIQILQNGNVNDMSGVANDYWIAINTTYTY